jgi:medium-chain acyl-[acyl-carrier-protein] hydrolase
MKKTNLPEHPIATRFLRMATASHAQARLFCFPFAGGSAAAFAGWETKLAPQIEVWAAQPRGRGMRFSEPPHQSVAQMVQDYLQVLRTHLDLPFAFYGHSFGALLALELAQQLWEEGLPLPAHLFIGASAPPVAGLIHPRISHLPDEGFVTAVQARYSSIPESVLRESELMEIFLPALKADFSAYETFDRNCVTRVHCPITALAGSEDAVIAPSVMQQWRWHTDVSFDLCLVPGDHFFLSTSGELVLSTIRKRMLSALPETPVFLSNLASWNLDSRIRATDEDGE